MNSDIIDRTDAFEKRLKRRIIGRQHSFFVSTAPGFESLCCNELNALPFFNSKAVVCDGGVEFQGRVHESYKANLYLSTASRILMRIQCFRSSNFRQLEKKLAEIDWELYFLSEAQPQIRVSTSNSRLFHKQAIAEKVMGSINKKKLEFRYLSSYQKETVHNPIVFVRAVNDYFSISLDSSGDLLYKRGIKTYGGKAPLRETIAAAALMLSGYTGEEPLIDPMCGSGTFSIEGALMANRIPPGWYRQFGFMAWPFFKAQRWEYIKAQAWNGEINSSGPIIFTSDLDREVCRKVEDNISHYKFSESISIQCRDFFDLLPDNISKKRLQHKGLIVINPPYGLRMGDQNMIRNLIPEILKKLHKDFKGWRLAMIISEKAFFEKVPFKFKVYPFFHGGLNLYLIIGTI